MKIEKLKDLLKDFGDKVKFDYDLKKMNQFNIGGKTKAFYKADNLKDLVIFLKKLKNDEKIFILGAGSNTLITDKIYDGVVIKLSNNFNNISLLSEDIIIAGSAVILFLQKNYLFLTRNKDGSHYAAFLMYPFLTNHIHEQMIQM